MKAAMAMVGHQYIVEDDDNMLGLSLVYGAETPIATDDLTRPISSAKKRRRPIDHLSFYGTRFKDGTRKVFRTLGKKLKLANNVKELTIVGMPDVGNEELASLAPFLNSSTTLRSLDLTGATFNTKAVEEVRHFFRRNTSLEVLVLGENECLGDDGVETVMSSLQDNGRGKLEVLAIESCGVGQEGAASISKFMVGRGGSSLRVLELSNNMIGDRGAETLATSIKRGHRLGYLGMNNSQIGDLGAQALGKMIKSNRSLHTLSLQNNKGITSVGASSLIKAVYNTDSIKTIIGSNHVLRNLSLRGCSNIDPSLLQLSTELSAHSRLLSSKDEVIRLKVTNYLKNAKHGIALQDFDLELMPHILAFVGKTNGMTSLFHTLKSMPLLYTQYDPEVAIKALEEKDNEGGIEEETSSNNSNTATFLEQLKLSSRRVRKYYSIFSNSIPKRSSMLRYQDRRIRNKHESPACPDSAINKNNNQYLSSTPIASEASSFTELKSYYIVLKQALLLWLFHTRCGAALENAAHILFKLLPRVSVFLFCPQA